jgi:hypothetical protein
MYSTLVKERAMAICILLVQLITIADKIKTYPNVNFLVFMSVAKSTVKYPGHIPLV